MRRAFAVAAALAASIALVACGGGGGGSSKPPPQGPPSARHPATELDAALAGELMRAHILTAARLYNNGKLGFATAHMATAQKEYSTITDAVRTSDSALDREFHAAFGIISQQIAQHLPPPQVMNRMALMQGQLLDAAIQDSVTKPALNDPGVEAQVMSRLLAQGGQAYAVAASQGFTARGKRAYQDAFGLITRASSLSHVIAQSLGPERNTIINSINNAHNAAFPTGVLVPRHMNEAKVAASIQQAQAAITRCFGFAT